MVDSAHVCATTNVSESIVSYVNTSLNLATPGGLISSHALFLFQWICYGSLCPIIGMFGSVTNIFNIICFIKQGFKDPVNISLIGLAIADLGGLLILIWLSVAITPAFIQANLPFDAVEVDYLTGGWPHVAFAHITRWITAFITLERCLCISVPLKVKAIVTKERTLVIIVIVYIVFIGSVSPVYCVNKIAMKFYPDRNKTILGLVFTEDRESVEKVSFAINNVAAPFSAFIVVSVCTAVLVIQLNRITKWRKASMTARHSDSITYRDKTLAKMIVIISTLFIACFCPSCITFIGMISEPEFTLDGQYNNLFIVVCGLVLTLESVNSSVNIFIYYSMSSRYRAIFRQLVCL